MLKSAPATFDLDGEPLAGDPYVRLVHRHLSDPRLFDAAPDRTRALQEELLRPFLDYFLRNGGAYYEGLLRRKGLLDESGGGARDPRGRPARGSRPPAHPLRRPARRARPAPPLVPAAAEAEARGKVFSSSGTTGNEDGPVTIVRSPLQLHFMALGMGHQLEWATGQPIRGATTLMQATPAMASRSEWRTSSATRSRRSARPTCCSARGCATTPTSRTRGGGSSPTSPS